MYPYIRILGRSIPTYGLCIMMGVGLCYLLANRRAVRQGLSSDSLLAIGAVTIGFAFSGAKLLYLAVTFSPAELWTYIRANKWNELMNGGLVFYGGLIGGLFGAWVGSKIVKTPLLHYEPCVAPFLPLGYGFGRIGCWFAGCCYGFPFHGGHFPTQLLDAAVSFGVCAVLALYSKTARPGKTLLLYLRIYAIQRFLIEFLRGDTVRGAFLFLSTSQWISVALLLFCVLFPLLQKKLPD